MEAVTVIVTSFSSVVENYKYPFTIVPKLDSRPFKET